jgi:catecholate siderophore receptor
MAGLALLDSAVLQSVADNAADNVLDAQKGEDIPNTPEASGSLWTSYLLPGSLEIGYGLTYIGKYKTEANALTTTVPDATIQNALIGYHATRGLNLRVNINNLADERWWSSVRPQGWAHPGEGRSFVLTANYEF